MAICRKTTHKQNRQSRLLHVLVRHPHAAHVFAVPIFATKMGLLAYFIGVHRVYFGGFLRLCDSS